MKKQEYGSYTNLLNPGLVSYVEKHVFPQYQENDGGHQLPHIRYVIRRSLKFSEQFENINLDMCYVAAAYHDIGYHIDRNLHELISAEIFMADKTMKKFFSDEERQMIKEAIEDHRSSKEGEPRHIYGKILSSADRSVDFNESLRRADAYSRAYFPETTLFERIQRAYDHIQKKYGPNGYAKSYVNDPELEVCRSNICALLSNKAAFVTRYFEACGLYPEVGIDKEYVMNLLGQKHYRKLEDMHKKKYELKFYSESIEMECPFVIEFTGTPRTGKTTMIHSLYDFFKKAGFRIKIIKEFTTSAYYQEELRPAWREAGLKLGEINIQIMQESLEQLKEAIASRKYDIILLDRSISDRQVWNYLRYKSGDIPESVYENYRDMYRTDFGKYIDMLVISIVDPDTCIKRDFASCLALEKRNFLTKKNVQAFNSALSAVRPILEEGAGKVVSLNTSARTIESTMLSVTNEVLSTMKEKYVERLEF